MVALVVNIKVKKKQFTHDNTAVDNTLKKEVTRNDNYMYNVYVKS